jgi:outer membrane biosynthesis protein TonB
MNSSTPSQQEGTYMKFIRLATVLVLAAGVTTSCNSPAPQADDRSAELERRLAETEKKLAEVSQKEQEPPAVAPPAAAPQAVETPPAAPARPPQSQPNAKPAAKPATKPAANQKPADVVTQEQAAKAKAEVDRLVEQQRAVNSQQAETNLRLKEDVEKLKPQEFVVPAGTVIQVRTTSELTTAKLADGSVFEAHLERDLKSGEKVLAPARSRVTGFVVTSDPGGRVKGTASLTVGVRSIVGAKGNVMAVTTDSFTMDAESTKKKDAVRTGVATGVGAIIGGIAGGGSGAAKGAGAGAAAGVGVSLATRGAAAVIPAESVIDFKLTAPLTVVIQP